jgi:hypothetical protein
VQRTSKMRLTPVIPMCSRLIEQERRQIEQMRSVALTRLLECNLTSIHLRCFRKADRVQAFVRSIQRIIWALAHVSGIGAVV